MRRYIRCSVCGKKMYENDRIFVVSGLSYLCCSEGCILYAARPDAHFVNLNERTVKYFDAKWCIDDSKNLEINAE